jgi:hypothetical protein
MELVAALLVAGPLGYFSPTRVMGLGLYLLVWAVIFPIQTTNVLEPQDTTLDTVLYFVFNAIILGLGVGLNTFGARRRARRPTRAAGTD